MDKEGIYGMVLLTEGAWFLQQHHGHIEKTACNCFKGSLYWKVK
jgi:hypothetical protein